MWIKSGSDECPDLPKHPGTGNHGARNQRRLQPDHEGFMSTQRGNLCFERFPDTGLHKDGGRRSWIRDHGDLLGLIAGSRIFRADIRIGLDLFQNSFEICDFPKTFFVNEISSPHKALYIDRDIVAKLRLQLIHRLVEIEFLQGGSQRHFNLPDDRGGKCQSDQKANGQTRQGAHQTDAELLKMLAKRHLG